jgi:hypothetical protein
VLVRRAITAPPRTRALALRCAAARTRLRAALRAAPLHHRRNTPLARLCCLRLWRIVALFIGAWQRWRARLAAGDLLTGLSRFVVCYTVTGRRGDNDIDRRVTSRLWRRVGVLGKMRLADGGGFFRGRILQFPAYGSAGVRPAHHCNASFLLHLHISAPALVALCSPALVDILLFSLLLRRDGFGVKNDGWVWFHLKLTTNCCQQWFPCCDIYCRIWRYRTLRLTDGALCRLLFSFGTVWCWRKTLRGPHYANCYRMLAYFCRFIHIITFTRICFAEERRSMLC